MACGGDPVASAPPDPLALTETVVSPPEPADNLRFGRAVALSADGQTLAVGAPGEASGRGGIDAIPDASAPGAGAVYVFVRMGDTWGLDAYLKPVAPAPGDAFGGALALSADGDRLAVGAAGDDGSLVGVQPPDAAGDRGAPEAGAVHVFVRQQGSWQPEALLKAPVPGAGDRFGGSVALSADGGTLAVGASGEDGAGAGVDPEADDGLDGAGAAYVYLRGDAGWRVQAYLKAPAPRLRAHLGGPVCLGDSGELLAVGASFADARDASEPPKDIGEVWNGAVHLFARRGDTWQALGELRSGRPLAGEHFGAQLSFDAQGDQLLVGARGDSSGATGVAPAARADTGAQGAGAAFLYAREGGDAFAYRQVAFFKASNTGPGDRFGAAVALSASGDDLVVGARDEDAGEGADMRDDRALSAGAAYWFGRGTAGWGQRAFLKAADAAGGDTFGAALVLSPDADALIVGAPGATQGAGRVHVFTPEP